MRNHYFEWLHESVRKAEIRAGAIPVTWSYRGESLLNSVSIRREYRPSGQTQAVSVEVELRVDASDGTPELRVKSSILGDQMVVKTRDGVKFQEEAFDAISVAIHDLVSNPPRTP